MKSSTARWYFNRGSSFLYRSYSFYRWKEISAKRFPESLHTILPLSQNSVFPALSWFWSARRHFRDTAICQIGISKSAPIFALFSVSCSNLTLCVPGRSRNLIKWIARIFFLYFFPFLISFVIIIDRKRLHFKPLFLRSLSRNLTIVVFPVPCPPWMPTMAVLPFVGFYKFFSDRSYYSFLFLFGERLFPISLEKEFSYL